MASNNAYVDTIAGKKRSLSSYSNIGNFQMQRAMPFAVARSPFVRQRRAGLRFAQMALRNRMRPQIPRGFVGVERKYVDLAVAGYAADTTGSSTLIATIPTGTTVNTRIGKRCQLNAVHIRGNVTAGSTGTIAEWACYVIWDRQPNKALATVATVLESAAADAFMKKENGQRFKVIKKLTGMTIGNNATPASGGEALRIDEYVKLKDNGAPCISSYTAADTTGVIGDLITGALLFITVGNCAAGTTAPAINVGFRVDFIDL